MGGGAGPGVGDMRPAPPVRRRSAPPVMPTAKAAGLNANVPPGGMGVPTVAPRNRGPRSKGGRSHFDGGGVERDYPYAQAMERAAEDPEPRAGRSESFSSAVELDRARNPEEYRAREYLEPPAARQRKYSPPPRPDEFGGGRDLATGGVPHQELFSAQMLPTEPGDALRSDDDIQQMRPAAGVQRAGDFDLPPSAPVRSRVTGRPMMRDMDPARERLRGDRAGGGRLRDPEGDYEYLDKRFDRAVSAPQYGSKLNPDIGYSSRGRPITSNADMSPTLGLRPAEGVQRAGDFDLPPSQNPRSRTTDAPLGEPFDPARERLEEKSGGRLTMGQRQKIPTSEFALPGKGEGESGKGSGSYPIPDESHARSALSLGAQHAGPAQLAQIKRKVHAKYPDIDIGGE